MEAYAKLALQNGDQLVTDSAITRISCYQFCYCILFSHSVLRITFLKLSPCSI